MHSPASDALLAASILRESHYALKTGQGEQLQSHIGQVWSDSGAIETISGSGGPGFETTLASATTYADATLPNGNWKTKKDRNGNITRYENYADFSRPGRIIEGWLDTDSSGTFTSGDGYARLTDYTYHPRLDRPLTISRESTLTGALGDAGTIFDYDDPSPPIVEPTDLVYARVDEGYTLNASGSPQLASLETRFTYDADGRVLTEEGPRPQNFTRHTYDGSGNRTSTKRYLNGDNSAFLETTFADFDSKGNPWTVTDPNGRVTSFTYDDEGRVETVVPPFGGTGDPTITFHYGADDRIEQIDFPAGYQLSFGYSDDEKGDLLFVADSMGDAIVYTYDRGKRDSAALYRNFSGDPENPGSAPVGYAEFDYGDTDGRLEKAYNPLFGQSVYTSFDHDGNGNNNSVVDENGKQDSLFYDALDRLKKVEQTRTATYETWFQRLPEANLPALPTEVDLRVIDPTGKKTDYVNDDFGRLVKVISPDTGTTIFNYDEAGNLTKKIEAFGTGSQRETNYIYDGLDRLLTINLPTNPDWTFTYDTDAAKNQKGRLARAESTPSTVTTDFEYTARGQLAKESTTYNARRYDVTYTYDAAGNVATIQTPSGTVMTYRYAGSRVSEVDVTKGSRTETIRGLKWLPFGPLDEAKLPPYDGTNNVVTLDRTYNLRYQLTELDVTGPSGAILDRSYSYTSTVSPGPIDPGPNLDKLVDNLDASESRFYFYDELDRLSRATDLSGVNLFEYGYDPAGNRTFKTDAYGTTSYAYETGSDRLEAATGAEQAFYANDAYGNRMYAGSTPYAGTPTYTHNEQNRLITAVTPQGTINAVYDAFGRRVAWQTLRFVYSQSGRILEVSNRSSGLWWGDLVWVEGELLGRVESTGAVGTPALIPPALARHLPRDPTRWLLIAGAAGSLVFVVLATRRRRPRLAWAGASSAALTLLALACVPTGLEFYWIYTDQIGFPLAMTDTPATPSQAKVIWRTSYEPFGLATEELDPDGDGKQVRMPMRFPGQWWDFATNLHDNFYRTYDPATGRYLEADPIGQSGGSNLYRYVSSNPMNAIDPLGLTEEDVRFIWRQGLREFLDVNPTGIPICGGISPAIMGSTSWWSGNITIATEMCEKACLTREEWESLFFTLFHESMHSSDPIGQRFLDAAAGSFGGLTSNHQGIHNRTEFERIRPPAIPNPIWGSPRSRPLSRQDRESLYDEYRKRAPGCGCQ